MIRGIVFDLDGTLVDSRLDFDRMREEMGLAHGLPILESIERLERATAERCRAILHRHELAGAQRATLLPGARELLDAIATRGIKSAIATRNSRAITAATLHRVRLAVPFALTRDDGPVKPDPWPVLEACRRWSLPPAEVLMIGDFRFDIECGRAAGCCTVLLTDSAVLPGDGFGADLVLPSLAEYPRLLAWLDSDRTFRTARATDCGRV
jgi:HAD superfamily hydrolase (TIGR01549 family)